MNNKIHESLDSIKLSTEDENRILDNIYTLHEKKTFVKRNRRRVLVILSVFLLCSITGITLYAAINHDVSISVKDNDSLMNERTLSFSVNDPDIRIPADSFSAAMVKESRDTLNEQFSSYDPLSSSSPDLIIKYFSTIESSLEYLGYPVFYPKINIRYNTVTMYIWGNSFGEITEVILTVDYHPSSSASFCNVIHLFTDKYDGAIKIDYIINDQEDNNVTTSNYIENGREFLVAAYKSSNPDWTSKVVFWQEDSAVYELQLRFTKAGENEAETYMSDWMNSFK